MKRDREESSSAAAGVLSEAQKALRHSATPPPSPPPRRRRTLRGKDGGYPSHAVLVEEEEEVVETQTILLRFPCFDFFRHTHLCETAPASAGAAGEKGGGSPARDAARFAPEALMFLPGTLQTDTPVAVLNRGTSNEMVFEGQWSEVCGAATAVTNRAIVHLGSATATEASTTDKTVLSPLQLPPLSSSSSAAAGAAPSAAPQREGAPPQIASLLSHVEAGRTADEERHERAEELRGWAYDRVDVPAAVLTMHRIR